MELYLQFGYGMMEHCRCLIREWGGGTVILSPRDLSHNQLLRLSKELLESGGEVLLDPQFYLPRADHDRLVAHDYWPNEYDTGSFLDGTGLRTMLTKLHTLNKEVNTSRFILPGIYAATINDDWLHHQSTILEEAKEIITDRPLIATICLSGEALKVSDQIHLLLDKCEKWDVDGYYLVCEHPNGDYLVNEPIWLANVFDLAAGLKLLGRQVIFGYCNHQFLFASEAKVDAIASGTWMNVRSFPPDKFRKSYEDEMKQRAVWYYCPQALSEYKIPFLDVAHRLDLLNLMKPARKFNSTYCDDLFSGVQPSLVGLSEQTAFRHYLTCLNGHIKDIQRKTFSETASASNELLDSASGILTTLYKSNIRGQQRDFYETTDVVRAALDIFRATRGPILDRKWDKI